MPEKVNVCPYCGGTYPHQGPTGCRPITREIPTRDKIGGGKLPEQQYTLTRYPDGIEFRSTYLPMADLYDKDVVDIRMRGVSAFDLDSDGPQYKFVIEVAVVCGACKETNWVVLGTDPSEYRCHRCTNWL
jgi:hypothetical protein